MSENLKNEKEIIPADKDIKIPLNKMLVLFMILSGIITSGLIYLLHKNVILAGEALLLMPLLTYLSAVDLKLKLAPDWSTFVIFVISVPTIINTILSQEFFMLINMVFGLLICFIPMFLSALFSKNGIGGADIKIMTALGFLLGAERAFLALMSCLLIAIVFNAIQMKRGKMEKTDKFAMIPFIAIGAALSMIVL